MKKIIISLISLLILSVSFGQKNPVLITVAGEEIRQDEFLYNYTKNNPDAKFDQASLDEYTEMFVKFKLKVADAKAKGYDTIPKLQNELKGYIAKSAEKYLSDSSATEAIKKEAYERKKSEVKASHIMFTGADAYNEAIKVKKEIEAGLSFEEAAIKYSDDPSATGNKGDLGYAGNLGYFTVFQMVYPFEEVAYNTPVGQISDPVKTRFGYHIIKVTDKRKNRGRVKVAHIYVKIAEKGNAKSEANAKAKIDEIYALYNKENRKFEELAKEYSDDNTSAKNGGELQWFTSGKMVPEFEQASFDLKVGDVSKPIKSSYGWHIVKKLADEPIGTYEEVLPEITSNLKRGDRSNKTKQQFVEKLKKEYKYKDKSSKWISNSFSNEVIGRLKAGDDKTAFKFKKEKGLFKRKTKVQVSEFREFLTNNLPSSQQDIELAYKEFVNNYFYSYEKAQLPIKYPEYKALVKEFEDGILLFEISDKEVWSKSSEDSTGLAEYFETQKGKYIWKKRADVEIFNSPKKEVIERAIALAKDTSKTASEILTEVNKESQLNLTASKGKYEIEGNEVLEKFEMTEGVSEWKLIDGKFIFIRVSDIISPESKKLNEVRGSVISDYQQYLEKQWLSSLKENYSVTINKEEIYNLKNN